jgi:hypothetical protein
LACVSQALKLILRDNPETTDYGTLLSSGGEGERVMWKGGGYELHTGTKVSIGRADRFKIMINMTSLFSHSRGEEGNPEHYHTGT